MDALLINGACSPVPSCSLTSRLTFEGIQRDTYPKSSIRYHSFLIGFILDDFKALKVEDIDGKIYYVNRASLNKWLLSNHPGLSRATKEGLARVADSTVLYYLNGVLRDKTLPNLYTICTRIAGARARERELEREIAQPGRNAIAPSGREGELATQRQILAEARAARTFAS